MYKEAIIRKLKWATLIGLLMLEQLFDLPVGNEKENFGEDEETLDKLAGRLQEEWKKSGKKSFLSKKTPKDTELKLKLDIVVDIINTKLEATGSETEAAEIKKHNQKIDELQAAKMDEEMKGLSVEDLEKLRR